MICACIAACSINILLCKSCFMVFKGTVSRGDKDELCYFLNVLLIIYVKDETVLHLLTKVRHWISPAAFLSRKHAFEIYAH